MERTAYARDETGGTGIWNPRQPFARRSLLLCGVGAMLGIAIAGVGLFTAQGTRSARVPPEDVAIVNGVPILRADFIQQLKALYLIDLSRSTPAQRRKVLEDMIREELYVQRGVEMGLPNDDIDVRTALVSATEAQVAQDAMTSRPSELELQAWYRAHPGQYSTVGTMTLHDWLAPPGAAAPSALATALRGGTAPILVGLRPSGRLDESEWFYFAARIHLGSTLFTAARALKDGAISEPISAVDGVHILQMVRNLPRVPLPYAEVRDQVLRDFLAAKVAKLQQGNERFLHKRADIETAADVR